jgi:DNA-binding NarL/FixJ family response regulator
MQICIMPRKTITIAIADDIALDQCLITHSVKSIKSTQILFYAKNGIELFQMLNHYEPDILIVDLYMPLMSGWEVLAELQRLNYTGNIIATSGGRELNLETKLRALGVKCFAPKHNQNIKKAIEAALKGITRSLDNMTEANIDGREIEIINNLAQGYESKKIGDILGLSFHSIDSYITILLNRFNCKNRAQLVAMAFNNGLIYTYNDLNNLPKPKPTKEDRSVTS